MSARGRRGRYRKSNHARFHGWAIEAEADGRLGLLSRRFFGLKAPPPARGLQVALFASRAAARRVKKAKVKPAMFPRARVVPVVVTVAARKRRSGAAAQANAKGRTTSKKRGRS